MPYKKIINPTNPEYTPEQINEYIRKWTPQTDSANRVVMPKPISDYQQQIVSRGQEILNDMGVRYPAANKNYTWDQMVEAGYGDEYKKLYDDRSLYQSKLGRNTTTTGADEYGQGQIDDITKQIIGPRHHAMWNVKIGPAQQGNLADKALYNKFEKMEDGGKTKKNGKYKRRQSREWIENFNKEHNIVEDWTSIKHSDGPSTWDDRVLKEKGDLLQEQEDGLYNVGKYKKKEYVKHTDKGTYRRDAYKVRGLYPWQTGFKSVDESFSPKMYSGGTLPKAQYGMNYKDPYSYNNAAAYGYIDPELGGDYSGTNMNIGAGAEGGLTGSAGANSGYAEGIDTGQGGAMDPKARAAMTLAASSINPLLGMTVAGAYKVSDTIRGSAEEMTDIYGNETGIYDDSKKVFAAELLQLGSGVGDAVGYAKEGEWGKAAGSMFIPGYAAFQAARDNEKAKKQLESLNERQEFLDEENLEGQKEFEIKELQSGLHEMEDKASLALTQNPKRSMQLSYSGRRVPKYNLGTLFQNAGGWNQFATNVGNQIKIGGPNMTGNDSMFGGQNFGYLPNQDGTFKGNFGFDPSTGRVGKGWVGSSQLANLGVNNFVDDSIYADTIGGGVAKGAAKGFAEGMMSGNLYAAGANALIGGVTGGIDQKNALELQKKKEAGQEYTEGLADTADYNKFLNQRLFKQMSNMQNKEPLATSANINYAGARAQTNPLLANDGLKMAKGAVGEANNGELFIDGSSVEKISQNANPHYQSQPGRPMTGEPFAFTQGGKPTLLNGNDKLTTIYETQQPGGGDSLIASNNPDLLDISDDMANKIFNI